MINRKRHSGKLWLVVSGITLGTMNLVLWAALAVAGFRFAPEIILRLFVSINLAYLPAAWTLHPTRVLGNRVIHFDRVINTSIRTVLLHAACFSALLFLQGIVLPDMPWSFLLFYFALGCMVIMSWIALRKLLKSYRMKGYNYERVVIVGTNRTAAKLARNMHGFTFGYRVLGHFDNSRREDFDGKYLGTIADLEEYIRHNPVDEIYFTITAENPEDIRKVMKLAEDNFIPFYYVPRISRYVDRRYAFETLESTPLLKFHPSPLLKTSNRIFKRTFDIVMSSAVLLLSPLVFIPVAIAIKLTSKGPVIFRQRRTGYFGTPFNCYKFRTMEVNPQSDSLQATPSDPRVTRVGRFLRRTSIDELPQFLNVFLGQMSVVGPRPHMVAQSEEYTRLIDQFMVRHIIRPGITGWAQVNGFRGPTPHLWQMEGRVERDVWYIEHWTFMTDLKIIFRTISNALKGDKNAI